MSPADADRRALEPPTSEARPCPRCATAMVPLTRSYTTDNGCDTDPLVPSFECRACHFIVAAETLRGWDARAALAAMTREAQARGEYGAVSGLVAARAWNEAHGDRYDGICERCFAPHQASLFCADKEPDLYVCEACNTELDGDRPDPVEMPRTQTAVTALREALKHTVFAAWRVCDEAEEPSEGDDWVKVDARAWHELSKGLDALDDLIPESRQPCCADAAVDVFVGELTVNHAAPVRDAAGTGADGDALAEIALAVGDATGDALTDAGVSGPSIRDRMIRAEGRVAEVRCLIDRAARAGARP